MTERPHISLLLLNWFTWYSQRFIKRHFHSLRITSSTNFDGCADRPFVLYTNHASWWDPLVGLVVIDSQFRARRLFAPIDATMLSKYRMFSKMGFFGIEKDTRKGAVDFLAHSADILSDPNAILAVTAQGRFADVRERPANIKRGLAHLAARVPNAVFIPACIEYVYWEDKLPEILVRFGSPVEMDKEPKAIESNLVRLERALETTQDELAELSKRRQTDAFTTLLTGRSGIGGVYDRWRSIKARMAGDEFSKEIGRL